MERLRSSRGRHDTESRLRLYRVGSAGAWSQANAGHFHTCAITSTGDLYCWGYNIYGQSGDGTTTTPRLTKYRVPPAGTWAGVAAGGNHTCARSMSSALFCWGADEQGQTGDNTASLSPRLIRFQVN